MNQFEIYLVLSHTDEQKNIFIQDRHIASYY